ncbi:hypothetical protein GCK32_017995 [Trichostrongylus colubriformis]|uniref:7TM GPCR serpentine receptor class x (Srx) domain-containing protein n=1 Tax=Trichostrongylus colubriformis TaxID=6319 RepID=A0AAN8GED6_TRICO
MSLDVLVYLNNVIHDIPSYALDRDIFETPQAAYVSIIIRCCQWFGQLFVLLVLSFIHFYAVFFPTHFRAITRSKIFAVNVSILVTGLLLTIPLLTPYCGYAYYVTGDYWAFDMSKSYTYIYWIFNIVLQIASVAVVALVDLIIIWKIYHLRSSSTVSNRNAFSSTVALVSISFYLDI